MDAIKIIELISLVTGIIFMILQVLQNRWMWYLELLTATAALIVSASSHLWAASLLNVYYIVMSVIGIFSWKKIEQESDADVHIVRISRRILTISAFIFLAGAIGLYFLLDVTSDPAPILDSLSFSLAIIGTWWLTRSHIEQWYVWFVGDVLSAALFFSQGHYWMGLQYICYLISSIIGYIHWKRKGTIVK